MEVYLILVSAAIMNNFILYWNKIWISQLIYELIITRQFFIKQYLLFLKIYVKYHDEQLLISLKFLYFLQKMLIERNKILIQKVGWENF